MKSLLATLVLCATAFAQQVDLNRNVKGALPITHGGTGATDAATARANLGIGTSAQLYASDYIFTPQAPGGTLTGGTPATATLHPCPAGVNGSDTAHQIRVSAGTGTAETVTITGGSCTSSAPTGTITFTPANNHTGAWTVSSATGGGQEAIVAAPSTGAAVFYSGEVAMTGCVDIFDKPIALLGTARASTKLTFASGLSCAAIHLAQGGLAYPDTARIEVGNMMIVNNTMNHPTINITSAQDATKIAHDLWISGGSIGIAISSFTNEVGISDIVIEDVGVTGLDVDMTLGGNHWVNNVTIGTKLVTQYTYGIHAYCTTAPACVGGLNMQNVQLFATALYGPTTAILGENTTGTRTALFIFMDQVLADGYFNVDGFAFKHIANVNSVNSWAVNHSPSPASPWDFDDSARIQLAGGISYADTGERANFSIINGTSNVLLTGVDINTGTNTVPAFYFSGTQPTSLILSGNAIANAVLTNDGPMYLAATSTAQVVSKLQGFFSGGASLDDWIFQNIDTGAVNSRKYLRVDNAGSLQVLNDAHNALIMNLDDAGRFSVGSLAFASLGDPADGAIVFCTNCVPGSNPCTSVGTGALALRANSAWTCGSGGGGGGSPMGPDTSIQSNNGGSFFGDSNVLYVRQVATPAAPVVTQVGTPGSTSYTYILVAANGIGTTAGSTSTVTTTGNATLDGTNFNRIATLAVTGVTFYKLFRTASSGTPSTTGFIGVVTPGSSVDDQGLPVIDSFPVPVTNTTIGLRSVNGFGNSIGPAIIGSQFGLNYNNPAGVNIQLQGQFIDNATLQPSYVLNSTGSNFGQMGNWSSTSWFLGYGTNSSLNGTRALEWNDSGLINIPGSLKVASLSGTLSMTAGVLGVVPGSATNCVLVNGSSAACSAGGGSVTSVGFTGGLISVASPTTTPAFTVAGTSGGIPYFSSSSTWASSGVLGANLPLFGGGAGASPIAGTRSGNTTKVGTVSGTQTSGKCLEWDASGNIATAGSNAACGAGGSGNVTTGVTLTANLPVLGNGGVDTIIGAVEGNTTKLQAFAGSNPTTGDCAQFDSNHNLVTAGAPCGTGSTNATQLQGRALAATAPADTNTICWDAGGATWKPCTSAGGGASSVAQLTDWQGVWTSASVLTVTGGNCLVGNTSTNVSGSATLTISAGTGTVRASCDKSVFPPTLKIYNGGLTISCSGMSCNNVAGTAYGADDSPVFQWTATAGAWDNAGGTTWRGIVGSPRSIAGLGLLKTTSNGTDTFSVDPTAVVLFAPVPANSAVACTPGSIAMDTSFLYTCVSSGAWRRVATSSF